MKIVRNNNWLGTRVYIFCATLFIQTFEADYIRVDDAENNCCEKLRVLLSF